MAYHNAKKKSNFKRHLSFFAAFFFFALGIQGFHLPSLLPNHGMLPHRFGQVQNLDFQGSGSALWKLSIQKTAPQREGYLYLIYI